MNKIPGGFVSISTEVNFKRSVGLNIEEFSSLTEVVSIDKLECNEQVSKYVGVY